MQCENPGCLKWRKVPWNFDVDTLGEKVFCKDNKWNPSSTSCEAPEDEWDETTDAQVDADGSAYVVESTSKMQDLSSDAMHADSCKIVDFKLGGERQVSIDLAISEVDYFLTSSFFNCFYNSSIRCSSMRELQVECWGRGEA